MIDAIDIREYYRHTCGGDSRPLLDPANYEWPRMAWLLERVSGSVLDVGCCTGDFAGHLAAQGYRVLGIDPGTRHIEKARERYPHVAFLQCFADEFARHATRAFDTVVAGDVIEHVPGDAAFLALLRTFGQRVLLTTPNGPWPSPEHLREYDLDSAADLVLPHGGKVELIPDRDGRTRWLGLDVPGET